MGRQATPTASSTDRIRVVVADDHPLIRAAMRAMLATADDIEVVGEAKNGRWAVRMAEEFEPDVVVMDSSMPDMDGSTATRAIRDQHLRTQVLVLTTHTDREDLAALRAAGVADCVSKTKADCELLDAIRRTARCPFVEPVPEEPELGESPDELTDRERAVLLLSTRGYTANEIAESLGISDKAVATYERRIQEKLGRLPS